MAPEARDQVAERLLEAGADPNADMRGVPLFVYVAQQCDGAMVRRFLEHGADLEARSTQGFSPLSMALTVKNLSAARALVQAGARLSPEAARRLRTGAGDEVAALISQAVR